MPIAAYLFLFALLGGAGFGGWSYIKHLNETRLELKLETERLRAEQESLKRRVEQQEADKAARLIRDQTLQAQLESTTTQLAAVRNLFNDHDFAKLAKEKPGLINARMQSATERLWRDFEREAERARAQGRLSDPASSGAADSAPGPPPGR